MPGKCRLMLPLKSAVAKVPIGSLGSLCQHQQNASLCKQEEQPRVFGLWVSLGLRSVFLFSIDTLWRKKKSKLLNISEEIHHLQHSSGKRIM